jgi:hypothetical protein
LEDAFPAIEPDLMPARSRLRGGGSPVRFGRQRGNRHVRSRDQGRYFRVAQDSSRWRITICPAEWRTDFGRPFIAYFPTYAFGFDDRILDGICYSSAEYSQRTSENSLPSFFTLRIFRTSLDAVRVCFRRRHRRMFIFRICSQRPYFVDAH